MGAKTQVYVDRLGSLILKQQGISLPFFSEQEDENEKSWNFNGKRQRFACC